MRWTRLFDDLEARIPREEIAERSTEVAEHIRSVRGQVALVDRLVAGRDQAISLRLNGGTAVDGRMIDLGADWILLATSTAAGDRERNVLVSTSSVLSLKGLSVRVDAHAGAASRRFDIRRALREISRDRSTVQVIDIAGHPTTGTIDRVGQDHFDVADHASDVARRASAVRGEFSIPFAALAMVRHL
ncbi:hypothetical protein K0651_11420 [Ornithinimicrobium sp. Arc0846-15]|nr:hypothetical protein [Ornithinimicrobium laminariae]